MRIWKRTNKGWEFAADYAPRELCVCGGSYTDTFNGEEFRWVEPKPYTTMEQLTERFNTAEICQKCYYRSEWLANRWCPAFWKQKFEA